MLHFLEILHIFSFSFRIILCKITLRFFLFILPMHVHCKSFDLPHSIFLFIYLTFKVFERLGSTAPCLYSIDVLFFSPMLYIYYNFPWFHIYVCISQHKISKDDLVMGISTMSRDTNHEILFVQGLTYLKCSFSNT